MPFSLAEALWPQRRLLQYPANRLIELQQLVNAPYDQRLCPWAYLFSSVHKFKPDLIIDQGRGYGNSTTLFTDCANTLEDCKVVSVSFDGNRAWQNLTEIKFHELVNPEWFGPLTVIHKDMMEFDFQSCIRPTRRIFLFWDAHGDTLAKYILGHILPLLEQKENLIFVHDIIDVRYIIVPKTYTPGPGCYFTDYLKSSFAELYPIIDFFSRNKIHFFTSDQVISEDIKNNPDRSKDMAEIWSHAFVTEPLLGDGNILYFSLNDYHDAEPIAYPPPPPTQSATELISRGISDASVF